MLIFKVVTIKDAVSALDLRVYLLVASTIMLSIALQETGGAIFISETIIMFTSGLSITSVSINTIYNSCHYNKFYQQ